MWVWPLKALWSKWSGIPLSPEYLGIVSAGWNKAFQLAFPLWPLNIGLEFKYPLSLKVEASQD